MSQWINILNSENHTYDNTTSGLTATTTKTAIDEIIARSNIGTVNVLFNGYREQGVNLGVTADKTIDIDGRLYEYSEPLTKNVIITVGNTPAKPICGSSVIYIKPNGHTVTFRGISYWTNGHMPNMGKVMRYIISTTVVGDVLGDGEHFERL